MNFRFDQPAFLWLLLLAVPIILLGVRSLATLDRTRKWLAIALRLAVLLILVLMLAGLQTVQRHTDLTVIAVVDQSESVQRFARPPVASDDPDGPQDMTTWARQYLRAGAKEKRDNDQFALVTFAGRADVQSMPRSAPKFDPGAIERPEEGTNTAAGIRTALALAPPDTGTRIVLVADGNDTQVQSDGLELQRFGSTSETELMAAVREARAAGIPIDVVPINYRVEDEVMVEGVYAPTQAREGQTVGVRVVLRATKPRSGLLQLRHEGRVIDLNPDPNETGTPVGIDEWTIEAQDEAAAGANGQQDEALVGRYVTVRQVDLPMAFGGPNEFEAIFEPDQGKKTDIRANNRARSFTIVSGKGRVLFVDGEGGASGEILPRALSARGIELEIIPPGAMPVRLAALTRYDAVIFQNVPADLISAPQKRMLSEYVNNLGGGFLMVGGPDSFGAGGWTNTPVDRILPVTCQIPSQTILPSGALVFVIDRSGSMFAPVANSNRSQMEVATEAAIEALNTLYPQDLVGVVAFDSSAHLIAKVQMNSDPEGLKKKLRSIQAGGGTTIYSGLEMGYQQLAPFKTSDAAIKHMILITDGQSNTGDYVKLAGRMARAGITLSTVGVGDGHDGKLLARLATMGNGHYYPVKDPFNLPQVFIKEARTIRKNLIKEGEFQPQLVTTGSPIMANIGGVPPLRGLVLTGPKEDSRVFMPIVGKEGEPVFAHWQVGLGRSAAFTADATNRWGAPWLNWGTYSDFWARTVKQIARPPSSRAVDLLTTVRGDQLVIRLDTGGDSSDGGPSGQPTDAEFLQVVGNVIRPDGETVEQVRLEQTGPGLYEALVPAAAAGNYIVNLVVQKHDGSREVVFGGASRPPGDELRRFESNHAMLRRIAEETGGRLLDPRAAVSANLFDRSMVRETRSIRPLWRTLLIWLIIMVLLDVANRRIAWEPLSAMAGARGAVGKVFGGMRSRKVESAQTLATLKRKRSDVQKEQAARAGDAAPGAAPAPASMAAAPEAPSRSRKFEAAEDAEVAEDFGAAVGAASATAAGTGSVASRKRDTGSDKPQTTSRLLDAKRRAREKLSDEE